MIAGAVVAPSRLAADGTSSTTAISMSVAVKLSLPSRTAISALARMGMVLRFSATLWMWANALIRLTRSALSFIGTVLRATRLGATRLGAQSQFGYGP